MSIKEVLQMTKILRAGVYPYAQCINSSPQCKRQNSMFSEVNNGIIRHFNDSGSFG